jgi:hypothetical protein
MSGFIEGIYRGQSLLVPDRLDDCVIPPESKGLLKQSFLGKVNEDIPNEDHL